MANGAQSVSATHGSTENVGLFTAVLLGNAPPLIDDEGATPVLESVAESVGESCDEAAIEGAVSVAALVFVLVEGVIACGFVAGHASKPRGASTNATADDEVSKDDMR